jgi:phosphoribosylamine--glycine ligase
MRILIISKEGDGLVIAHRLQKEGHVVDMYIKDPHGKNELKGIINRVTSFRPYIDKADLIIFDMVGFSHLEDMMRGTGKPYLCCNKAADIMELDRVRGTELLKKAGVTVPEYTYCKNVSEALKILKDWNSDEGYVVKPSGNLDTGKTYLCETPEIYEWALSTFKPGQEFIVQALLPKAGSVEISTEGWFNGRDWIKPFNHTFEEKRFMIGEVGKLTGCMGNLVVNAHEGDKLVQETLLKMTPALKACSYRGPFDINCIVTKEKAYALEMSCRFGYDAIDALMEGLKEPMADLLFETAMGVKKTIDYTNDFSIAVPISRDPWPACHPQDLKEPDEGMPVSGITEDNLKHIYLKDIYKDKDTYRYAACDGVLMKVTAHGRTIKETRDRVYRTVHNIKAIDIQYRVDIGERAEREIPLLKDWGWI